MATSTSTSTSFSSSFTSSFSSSLSSFDGYLTTVSSCFEQVLELDVAYGRCVMNSGLFSQSLSSSNATNALTSELLSTQVIIDTIRNADLDDWNWLRARRTLQLSSLLDTQRQSLGTCRLHCTNPSIHSSSSCCDAGRRLRMCGTKQKELDSCKSLFDGMLPIEKYCGITSATIVLFAMTVFIITLFGVLVWLSRTYLSKRRNGLKLRTIMENVVIAWKQITNQVWKNLLLRKRHPVKLVMELLLPVLLVGVLTVIVNLDLWFSREARPSITATSTATNFSESSAIWCLVLEPVDIGSDTGVVTDTQLTFYSTGQSVLGLYLLLSYIKFVSATITSMVIEKESRIREIMRIMGLPPYTLLISWALTSFPIFTPLSFIVAAELKYGGVFPYAEYSTLVFLFWSLGIAIAAFAYCMTPFFSKSRTASVASSLIWLILFFPFLSVKPSSNTEKYFAAILPPTAFSLGVDSLVQFARLGRGLSYATAVMETPIKAPTAEAMSWILLLDAMLLYAFGWYFERVVPQQYGTPKPWNFLFTGRLRCSRSILKKKCVDLQINSPNGDNFSPSFGFRPLPKYLRVLENSSYEVDLPSVGTASSSHIEQVDAALLAQERSRDCLKIINLRKVFTSQNGETRTAVKGLNLSMYSGHITALLGHNGAGKTTTISMLTGLLQPSSGDVTFNGQYLSEDLEDLRKSMGVCPQHDVLISDLTVDEHLRLFGAMKCISKDELAEDIASLIHDINLDDKTHTLARNLSGGQKRKLSVALAFIGRSKLVFMDEPTSGMDPHSRRFTWNLLRKNRQGRVIVLTTHFMDEADLLGDRIAIMVDGELRCVGSSFFLKKHFGSGYNLTATILPKYDEKVILQFLRRFIDDASVFSSHGAEVIFQLPSSCSGVFVEMLENLEASKSNFGISDYGISVSTLEEVFLCIAKDREQNEHIEDNAITNSMTDELGNHLEAAEYDISSDQPPFHRQLKAMLMKRIRITRRDKRFVFVLIGIPLVFLILLVSIPEINIAQFLSVNNYALTRLPEGTISEKQRCASDYFQGYQATLQRCRRRFRYCSVGVIECNVDTCCDFLNTASPYFACNTCESRSTPCYNNRCLSQQGANLQAVLNSFLVSVIVVLAFTFIPASIVDFIVREKEADRNAKDLQLICGASIMSYWWSNLIHDVALASIPCICGIILVPLSIRTLHAPMEILGVAALITTHVAATIPMAYVFSFYFEQHARAQTGLIVFMLSSGCLLSIFSLFCRLIDFGNVSIIDRSYLRWIFLLFPGYSLNTGIHEIANRKVNRNVITNWLRPASPTSFFGLFDGLGTDTSCIPCWLNNVDDCCNRGVFDLDTAGASIIYAVVEAAIFTLLVFKLERKAKRSVQDGITHEERLEDDDVAQERERVLVSSPTESDAVFLRNIRQEYREDSQLLCQSRCTKVAIRDLCLAIPRGECFGYLGINGAGKSSTIRILTGQMAPTRGAAFIGQYDLSIESDRNKARSILGYCPQFDALHEYLTVEEQLELYARLKGVSESVLPIVIREKISQFRLEVYRSKLTRDLSGGNKRKVSTAIALINSPQVIILDEPSTGMDPGARRKMWDVIAEACNKNQSSVILTTHSMEECEALCSRMGILVNGELKCLGSIQHLKCKFGNGYTVEMKLQEPRPDVVTATRCDLELRLPRVPEKIDTSNVAAVCRALGGGHYQKSLSATSSIATYLRSMTGCPLHTFIMWWLMEDRADTLRAFMHKNFANASLVEQQGTLFRYHLPRNSNTLLPIIFRCLEDAKAVVHLEDYAVSDTPLEKIFSTMAANPDTKSLYQS